MKIIIDAMGGDNAPLEIVKGALLGMEHWGLEVLLTAATEAMARDLADRFRKDPEGVYTRLLSALYPPAEQ